MHSTSAFACGSDPKRAGCNPNKPEFRACVEHSCALQELEAVPEADAVMGFFRRWVASLSEYRGVSRATASAWVLSPACGVTNERDETNVSSMCLSAVYRCVCGRRCGCQREDCRDRVEQLLYTLVYQAPALCVLCDDGAVALIHAVEWARGKSVAFRYQEKVMEISPDMSKLGVMAEIVRHMRTPVPSHMHARLKLRGLLNADNHVMWKKPYLWL